MDREACCSPWGHKESDTTDRLNWTESTEQDVVSSEAYLVYNKENISNKWEKDGLLNRFAGEMSNHWEKNRPISHTISTNYR